MDIELTINEARVIGCLLEKELTTPEQYPLSLNSLTNACNQKSNRDPVMALTESEVQATVDGLKKRHFLAEASASRVTKYKHRFCNTEFGTLKFDPQSLAVLIVMLLRGPQMPGELRSRTNRLCEFSDVHEVQSVLDALMARDEPLVIKLPREAGRRDCRYGQLFCAEMSVITEAVAAENESDQLRARVAELEKALAELQLEYEQLQQRYELRC